MASHYAVTPFPGAVSITEDGRTATHRMGAAAMREMALHLLLVAREIEPSETVEGKPK